MGLFTFDWSQIAYIGSPLVIPWWAQVNVFFGFFFAFWVIVPAMYYSNVSCSSSSCFFSALAFLSADADPMSALVPLQVWDSAYLPISSSSVYDRFGETYSTSSVVDTARMALNITAYEEYSPLYLPITYATCYGLAFMLATSIIVHTAIYHGEEIMARIRSVKNSEDDIHMKLMREYPEVPDWWYMVFLLISVGMSIAAVAVSAPLGRSRRRSESADRRSLRRRLGTRRCPFGPSSSPSSLDSSTFSPEDSSTP